MSQQSVKEAITQTVSAVQADANAGMVKYRAETQWEGDVRCTAKVRDFDTVVIDEPAAFGGGDEAMSPADVILVALGTCQEIMYAALASSMDIQLDECKVDVSADLDLKGLLGLDPDVPPGLLAMDYQVRLKSPASDEKLKELIDVVERQCPLLDTLTRDIKVTGKVNINDRVDYVGAGSYLAQQA
ncbi:MAG: OsmC family protein [Gammaproteobacteria bacterium]